MDNSESEKLFWKVYRNKFLNVQIWKVLKFRECMTLKYKEIHGVEWMLKRGYKMLLLDKVMNKKYLTFTENDIKQVLQDQLYKNNEEFFKILKHHYKIHQSTTNDKETTVNQFEQFDIIKLSILCGNITSLKVFYDGPTGSGTGNGRSVDGTSYLDVALAKNNFEILKFVYKEIGEKSFVKDILYMYLFTEPNEKVIQFALDEMGIKFSARQIPLWIFFKIDLKLVKRLVLGDGSNGNGSDMVTQIVEPISSFCDFFYDVFQGTISDLVNYCKVLLFIQEIYRKDLIIDQLTKSQLNKLSVLVGDGIGNGIGIEEQDQTKLYWIDNSNPVIELLCLYMNLVFKLCWRNDFKDQHHKVLIEYGVRFSDIKILESLNQIKKQTNEILNKSTEYCNETIFNHFISNGSNGNKSKFEANNKLFYRKLNDINGPSNRAQRLIEIKSFFNNCLVVNQNQIGKTNLFRMLIQLDNLELLELMFEKLFISNISTTILPYVQSIEMLQTLASSKLFKYKKCYSLETWDPETLLKRTPLPRYDLINVLDGIKLLDKFKSNESYGDKLILNGYYKCDIVEYLVLNKFKMSNELLTNLVSTFKLKSNLQLEKKKFKLILDLSDEHPELNIPSYGNGFKAMMVYTGSPNIISFINDYRWFDITNGKYKFKLDLFEQTSVTTDQMFEFLLTSGNKYQLLIHYLTEIKSNENMSMCYFKIGESGILEIIKLYFNFIKQSTNTPKPGMAEPQELGEDEEEQLPTPTNYLQSILAGSIKRGHLESIKLFEKHQPQLFEKDTWSTFLQNNNIFPIIYKYKFLESYIQNILSSK